MQAHNTASSNDIPFSERDKVVPCGPLGYRCMGAKISTIAVQTFQNLQDVIQIANNNHDRLATAVTSGYGVAVAVWLVLPPSHPSLLLAQFADMAARMVPGRQRQNPLFNPKLFLQEQYCYTYGLCAYSSKDCRTPGPTHNVQATAKNTMGGAAAKRRAKWTWRCGVELKKVCTITTTDFKSNFIYQSLAQQP